MPEIGSTITNWMAIGGAGLGLNAITFGTLSTSSNYNGAWTYLEGCTVDLDGETYDAHITITKKPSTGARGGLDWTYCHFTVTRKGKNHVFYEVGDDGSFQLTGNLLDQEGKSKAGKAHYKNDHINDAGLSGRIEHDIRLIFRHLAT